MPTATETNKQTSKGGEFLIKETPYNEVFTKEDLTEEQRMLAQTAADFIATRVMPNLKKIDHQEPGLVLQLLKESAELGLMGSAIPEEYGGMGLDMNTDTAINEEIGIGHSFTAA